VCAVARPIVPGDLDLAGQDNTKPRATLPSLDSGAPTSKERTSPEPPDPFDLERLVCGKHLLAPRVDD
jgi:hypothetical protein